MWDKITKFDTSIGMKENWSLPDLLSNNVNTKDDGMHLPHEKYIPICAIGQHSAKSNNVLTVKMHPGGLSSSVCKIVGDRLMLQLRMRSKIFSILKGMALRLLEFNCVCTSEHQRPEKHMPEVTIRHESKKFSKWHVASSGVVGLRFTRGS